MADLPFVDTHVHYWDLQLPQLYYEWLQPGWVHPILGDIQGLKVLRYGVDEYLAETRFHNVAKVVHVQAAIGILDPVAETEWLQKQADRTGYPQGIVGHCDLGATDALEVLSRHMEFPNFRGVRDFGHGDYMSPAWLRGYGLLSGKNLVYCTDARSHEMDHIRRLAEAFPDVLICIDHAGWPSKPGDSGFQAWVGGLKRAAGAPNVVCKISGVGMSDHQWTTGSIREWLVRCIDAFGVDRTLFGTNWPVDRLYGSFGDVVDAYASLVAEFSADEQTALFSQNAERTFRI